MNEKLELHIFIFVLSFLVSNVCFFYAGISYGRSQRNAILGEPLTGNPEDEIEKLNRQGIL